MPKLFTSVLRRDPMAKDAASSAAVVTRLPEDNFATELVALPLFIWRFRKAALAAKLEIRLKVIKTSYLEETSGVKHAGLTPWAACPLLGFVRMQIAPALYKIMVSIDGYIL